MGGLARQTRSKNSETTPTVFGTPIEKNHQKMQQTSTMVEDASNTPAEPAADAEAEEGNEEEVSGAFCKGDAVAVSSKGSAYHGQNGVIDDFCKNGSSKQICVRLQHDGVKRLSVGSLKKVAVPAALNQDQTVDSDMDSVMTNNSAHGRRVLTSFEFVNDVRRNMAETTGN